MNSSQKIGASTHPMNLRLGHPLIQLDQTIADLLGQAPTILNTSPLPEFSPLELNYIRLYRESLQEAKEMETEQISLKSLWLFLNKLRWRYPMDMFDTLRDDDVVEVYSLENFQIFRSFRYFRHCSYSLDEIYSQPWFELYERDNAIQQGCLNYLQKGMAGKMPSFEKMDLPSHWTSERKSPLPYHTQLHFQHCGVLHDQGGNITGYLVSTKVLESYRGKRRDS